MLSLIIIKNYAIIDHVEINLSSGLTVMTGETGAGKSILVDAIGLALGDRATTKVIRKGSNRAEISLAFDLVDSHPAIEWLKENCLDEDGGCLIRRIVNKDGKSRAFINSHNVSLNDLKRLGDLLIEIHGQHSHQSLLKESTQREILDFISNSSNILKQVQRDHSDIITLKKQLDAIDNSKNDDGQLEFLNYQYQELKDLDIKKDELKELESRQKKLANVDKINKSLNHSLKLLSGDESATLLNISHANKELKAISKISDDTNEIINLLYSAEIQIDEAIKSINKIYNNLESDPLELDKIENRLSKIREISRKHKINDNDLYGLAEKFNTKILAIEDSGKVKQELKKKLFSAQSKYQSSANKLSSIRSKNIKPLEKKISNQLEQLGMPNTEFKIHLEKKDISEASNNGLDKITFTIRTNAGQDFGPLSEIASGGELSRISLALEVVRLGCSPIMTMIFDEVDSGIGGKIAEIVGRLLNKIAKNRQVLCVTHLAQVASQGKNQFRIIKKLNNNSTITEVSLLDKKKRVDEISRMLGGIDITDTTRAHAEEMISQAEIS
ncbi:MAG: DNA repair protein RecN [Gammaproteobacteria bacterium]|nr:DNA repair protein RecN [Gammaproteobacteria bacterium]